MVRRLVIIISLLVPAHPLWAIDITDCGAVVPENETGVLQNDLDCDASSWSALFLRDNATLDLNGHSITGTFSICNCTEAVVRCDESCTIVGPGEIYGASIVAVAFGTEGLGLSEREATRLKAHLTISDVTIDSCSAGIDGLEVAGPRFPRRTSVTATNVTVDGNSGCGICVGELEALNVTANRNGAGIAVTKLRGTNVTASNNTGGGLFGNRIVVDGLIANDNGGPGIRAISVRLKNSQVGRNTYLDTAMDLMTRKRPRLVNSTCGRSQKILALLGANWGVCTED